jgi:hypothetical protein
MSVTDSKTALSKGTKELFARWMEVREIWSDAQAREFEKTYLAMIEQEVRGALSAMDQINQTLFMVRRDCE